MDGLLLNTEDIYTLCHNILLARYNAGPMNWTIKSKLQGRPAHEAIALLLSWANVPDLSPEDYTRQLHEIQAEEFTKSKPLPGVEKLLKDLKGSGVQIALATSSHRHHFEIKTNHLGPLFSVFDEDKKILGDDPRIAKGRGKPQPDIYLLALRAINDSLSKADKPIGPEECLVFEDGIPGVVAGRRAGMRVVWVPHEGLAAQFKGQEDKILAGLAEDDGVEIVKAGAIGDGWAEQRINLEDFPYGKYGIEV